MSEVKMSAEVEQKSSAPAFRLVAFQNIPETYQFDQPVACTFTVDSSFSPSAQDRIGLYKVGWGSLNDHVSVVNIELPLSECSGTVTFRDVPKDDEEFYQFCYVSSSSHVYGASSPFQFVADDFEIIEDILDVSLLDSYTVCTETEDSKNVIVDEVMTLSERPVLEDNNSLGGPDTARSGFEDHLSKLTEENRKLAEELSCLKMELTKSQFLCKEQKCVSGLEQITFAESPQNDYKGGTGNDATVATSSKDTSQQENTLYSTTTWFHNPYSNYLPANVTDFSNIRIVTNELWPKNEIIPGNGPAL